jgi:hypothetical protein
MANKGTAIISVSLFLFIELVETAKLPVQWSATPIASTSPATYFFDPVAAHILWEYTYSTETAVVLVVAVGT